MHQKLRFSLPQKTIRRWYASRLAVILESLLIGFVGGLVTVGFRLALEQGDGIRQSLYNRLARGSWLEIAAWAACLGLLGLGLGWASGAFPMIKGSGIPQVKGSLAGNFTLHWHIELPLKIITGLLGLGVGLSLGREGPSIQISAYVGIAILYLFNRPAEERRFLLTAAAAAGLSAAFSAPLAGVLFVLEELQSSFSPLLIACAMACSMAADAAAGLVFGFTPVFDFRQIAVTPIHNFPWVIVLGIICALFGDLFKRALYAAQDFYQKLQIPQLFRPILPLLISVPLCFYFIELSGGGHGLIESLSTETRPLQVLALFFLIKLLFTALCYGSGVSGGIFLPLLACGALLGTMLGQILGHFDLIAADEGLNFMILGMAAFFAAVVKAPVTGVILILEMSGNFNHLGSLVLVSLSAFVTCDLIASRPVYAVLLERMLKK